MARYNINNHEIKVCKCKACGNEADVSEFWLISVPGLKDRNGYTFLNPLIILDRTDCCDHPNYAYVE